MPLNPRDVALLREIVAQLQAGLTTSDADTVTELQGIAAQLGGSLTTRAPAPTQASGPIGALNAEVVLAVPQGAMSVTFYSTTVSAFTGTLTAQISFDGGATYLNASCTRGDSSAVAQSTTIQSPAVPFVFAFPPGVTHVRARATAYTSGALNTTITVGVSNVLATIQTLALAGANTRIGYAAAPGMWFSDSTTPLAGGATFTGTVRDATGTAAAAAVASAAAYHKEVNLGTVANVAGTLQVEISPDNVAWSLYDSVAASAVGSGFVAKLTYKPVTRYWRMKYVNGAGAQASFLAVSFAMAA